MAFHATACWTQRPPTPFVCIQTHATHKSLHHARRWPVNGRPRRGSYQLSAPSRPFLHSCFPRVSQPRAPYGPRQTALQDELHFVEEGSVAECQLPRQLCSQEHTVVCLPTMHCMQRRLLPGDRASRSTVQQACISLLFFHQFTSTTRFRGT